jgi:hypothetical protein
MELHLAAISLSFEESSLVVLNLGQKKSGKLSALNKR